MTGIINFLMKFSIRLEKVYDDTLKSTKESFPQYVRELEGVADGAKVEFHKVSESHFSNR